MQNDVTLKKYTFEILPIGCLTLAFKAGGLGRVMKLYTWHGDVV